MKIANSQPIWRPSEFSNHTGSGVAPQGSVPSPAILFGRCKSKTTDDKATLQDPKLAAEIERLTQRAPKIFGKPLVTKAMKPLLQKRALYNLKADPSALTECFPYRQLLVQKNDVIGLNQYDALVDTLMNKAEFYEVEKAGPTRKAVDTLYNVKSIISPGFENNFFHALLEMLKHCFSRTSDLKKRNTEFRSVMNFMQKIAKCFSDQTLSTRLSNAGVKPLQDPSTRYLVAASISDLLFKSPEQANQLLNNPKHPLRFIVGKEQPLLTLGQFRPGFNLILLNETELWAGASKSTKESYTSQHEFVHALSDPVGGEVLPSMSEDQKSRFLKAREELQTLYTKKDAGPIGWIRRLWNGHTATGLGGYAFFNNFEFLAVSSDTFKAKPKDLCRTQPGQEIYQIYKDIFKMDPLKDYQRHNIDA
ncbi:zinc-dependent peptidase [Vampirovibrio chlorellavorus]|uniref:zinc-dependent peptidase n=1 Tax=Vampirovibrio chlorellavorus TaxID=758823 RepID=UPI0026EDD9F5|nr:zinc-dependent peptidase [Vampirovibrio chlorellavorus]